jgi:hypothetical protein
MFAFLLAFLYLVLYVVIIEVCLWIIAKVFEPVPDKVRKGLYGIVALLFIIGVVGIIAGGWHPMLPFPR